MATGGCSKQGWILFGLVAVLGFCILGVAAVEPKDLNQYNWQHQNKRVDAKALMEDVCTKNFRLPEELRTFRSEQVDSAVLSLCKKLKQKDPHLALLFANTFPNTLDSTVSVFEEADPLTFIVSDGRSMSLRSSTWQARPYLRFAKKDPQLKALLKGVVKAQVLCLSADIYANSCMFQEGTVRAMDRRFESGSLSSVVLLSYEYYQATKDTSIFTAEWVQVMKKIFATYEVQTQSTLRFGSVPKDPPLSQIASSLHVGQYQYTRSSKSPADSLMHGQGSPGGYCGLIKSPFRPCDEAATFLYSIPGSAFAVVAMQQLTELFSGIESIRDETFVGVLRNFSSAVNASIYTNGVLPYHSFVQTPIFAYEIDGLGSSYFIDDANIPSLLSLPLLGFIRKNDILNINTREAVLSYANPYYSSGFAASGIGSPRSGTGIVWPMSIIVQAMTSNNDAEIVACLEMLKRVSKHGFIPESFSKDDASKALSRPWFPIANSLFGSLILRLADERPHLIFRETADYFPGQK